MVCLLELYSCCCCFNVRRGSAIVLWLNLILSGCSLIASLFAREIYVYHNLQTPDADPEADAGADKYFLNHHELVINVVFSVLVITTSIFGLIGIYTNKPSYLKAYVIVRVVDILRFLSCSLILLILWISDRLLLIELAMLDPNLFLIMTISVILRHFLVPLSLNYIHIFNSIIINLIQWYWTSVVHMQYVEMKEGRVRGKQDFRPLE